MEKERPRVFGKQEKPTIPISSYNMTEARRLLFSPSDLVGETGVQFRQTKGKFDSRVGYLDFPTPKICIFFLTV